MHLKGPNIQSFYGFFFNIHIPIGNLLHDLNITKADFQIANLINNVKHVLSKSLSWTRKKTMNIYIYVYF